jgi:hypothetical protein
MFVRWVEARSISRRRKGQLNRLRANLVECVRIDGKPRQRFIACIATLGGERRCGSHPCVFWDMAGATLEKLNLNPDDRRRIEDALSQRVPRVSDDEMDEWRRGKAEFLSVVRQLSRRRDNSDTTAVIDEAGVAP